MGAALLSLLVLAPDPVAELADTLRRFQREPYEQRRREEAVRELGRIGTPAAVRVLEGVLADPWVHLRDEAVTALIQLRRKPPTERAASVRLLGELLQRRGDEETRRHLATALGLMGDDEAVPALAGALEKARDAALVEALATALSRMPDERGLLALRARVAASATGRAACLRALGNFEGGIDLVLRWAHAEEDGVRAAVAEAMARSRRDVYPDLEVDATCGERFGIALAEALPAVRDAALARRRAEALLGHPSWRVRAAAVRGVAALRDPALLGDLVGVLDDPEGRLRLDAWMALRRLLGRDLPPDAQQWRALLPAPALAEGDGPPAPPRMSATYFGLPVASGRIAFVFDVSGSMRDDRKMERAREAFGVTLAALAPGTRYDLFAYRYLLAWPPRPRLERCFGRPVAGRDRAAAAWLGDLEPKGGGAIFDALAAAIADDDVDTVYLLSDGVPSFGTVARDFRVLQEVARLNRWRRVAIHTVLLGDKGTDREFMRRLAAENGGVAVDAGGKPLR